MCRANSKFIYEYDLTKTSNNVRSGTPDSALSVRQNYYDCGMNNYLDLAVDESGLYAIYNVDDKVQISKLQLAKGISSIKTVKLDGAGKFSEIGNAFVACGVLYTLDKSTGRLSTINYAYDIVNQRQFNPNIQFENYMDKTYSLSYNPAEKKLYAYSLNHLVTYPLEFSPRT